MSVAGLSTVVLASSDGFLHWPSHSYGRLPTGGRSVSLSPGTTPSAGCWRSTTLLPGGETSFLKGEVLCNPA